MDDKSAAQEPQPGPTVAFGEVPSSHGPGGRSVSEARSGLEESTQPLGDEPALNDDDERGPWVTSEQIADSDVEMDTTR